MPPLKKIAIYSGEIPSTTFIERIILGVAQKHIVLLFGFQKNNINYNSTNIKLYGYKNVFDKVFYYLKYSFLLNIFDYKNKKKLDKIIEQKKENNIFLKIKYYPVLYYKPEIFHLQWAKGIDDWIWVKDFGIKIILSLRGTHITVSPYSNDNLKNFYFEHFPKIDGFHAVSKSLKREVLQYHINPKKIKVIYSGLNLTKHIIKAKKTISNKYEIISVGRNHWIKGYVYALDAFKILKDKDFNFKYKIIGIDKNAEELILQKSQLNLNDSVDFLNQLSQEKVFEKIKNANILLLSSVEEGIANVILESMALGTIVIATNSGGINEVIIDGFNGFLIPIRNPEAIAEKIIEISKLSINEINEIRQNAFSTITSQHDIKNMIKNMLNFYEKVCKA